MSSVRINDNLNYQKTANYSRMFPLKLILNAFSKKFGFKVSKPLLTIIIHRNAVKEISLTSAKTSQQRYIARCKKKDSTNNYYIIIILLKILTGFLIKISKCFLKINEN